MRVTERITRIDDDTPEYAFTVVDPHMWGALGRRLFR
jgi:hypothetical protein